ncbi:MAG: TAXI family TRAP transporter solute-binding subunit [Alphaproteobacteria bacterium]|nr:TAXI family TRAP transporter solute-binding subunit [Alphaproteobacteria bacterium]
MLKTLALGVALTMSAGLVHAEEKDYVLNTASTGGTYHPVGTAISTLTKVKLLPKEKFSLTAVNSAGSGANVQALGSGTADFAILQGLFGAYAKTGTGPVSEPQSNLRSVSMLWQNVEHFVIPTELVKTGTMEDLVALKGQAAGMGRQSSGTIGSNRVLLAGLGLNMDEDFELMYGGYGPTASALANGQIVAAGLPAGPPVGAVTQLLAANSGKFTILNVTADELAKMDDGRNLWVPYTVPAGTYPGQTSDIQTIGQPNFLAVNDTVDENHVYMLTKTMYENLAFLQAIHPATNAMSLEKALAGLPVPLHPGAQRYYEEMGLAIPDHLKAQ